MADNNELEGYVTAVRVLQYYGPKEWVERTLAQGQVPATGMKEFAKIGALIQSGVVQWVPLEQAEQPVEPRANPIVVPPPPNRGN